MGCGGSELKQYLTEIQGMAAIEDMQMLSWQVHAFSFFYVIENVVVYNF